MTAQSLAWQISEAIKQLKDASPTPRLDAELLMAHALGVGRTYLLAHAQDLCPPEKTPLFRALIARRRLGVSVAYLRGTQSFWSEDLVVGPAVLVPRPETEALVSYVLESCSSAPLRVLDVGTGSGAIALALALERPWWAIEAVDLSLQALACARHNARRWGAHVSFQQSDLMPLGREYDVVMANLPYIPEEDASLTSPGVCYEPLEALISGPDGVHTMARLLNQIQEAPWKPKLLLLEHGASQTPWIETRLQELFPKVEALCDTGGVRVGTVGTSTPRV